MANLKSFRESAAQMAIEGDIAESSAKESKYDSDPLLEHRFFYSVPFDLLASVVQIIGQNRFDTRLIELDLSLSARPSEVHKKAVRWHSEWIAYEFLSSHMEQTSERDSGKWSQQDQSVHVQPFTVNHLYSNRKHFRIFQSYLGWLLTDAQFLSEHDHLLKLHRKALLRWGLEHDDISPVERMFGDPNNNPNNDPSWTVYRQERDIFYCRWRLIGLAAPYLPIPVGYRLNSIPPVTYFIQKSEQTGLYLLPDILPVPNRNEIRNAVDESRARLKTPNHLSGWMKLIKSGNKGKNRLDRFTRIFKLQHYWRVIHSHHKLALRSSIGKLEAAFAKWLHVSEETIHQDRLEIRRRLGRDWLERKWTP